VRATNNTKEDEIRRKKKKKKRRNIALPHANTWKSEGRKKA
jgi:hypothetical protein